MDFYLTDTHEKRGIAVCPWTGSGYGPDCFHDLDTSIRDRFEFSGMEDAYLCTSAEFIELVDFWEEEIRCMNAREIGQNGDDYTELIGDELVLITD